MGMNLIKRAKMMDLIHFGEDAMPKLSRLMSRDIESVDQFQLTLDWKSFDSTVPNFVISWVFDLLTECIDFSRFTLD